MLDVGSVVAGRYRIEGELGRGGMGKVLVARHLVLGERVALKIVSGQAGSGGADPSAIPRLLREARAAARLRSDYIVRVLDVLELAADEGEGDVCLVLEHVDGPTLARELAARGPCPVDEAVTLVLQIAVGLAEAHAHGVVHRDLKPANVLLATLPNGRRRPRIIDFGVAKARLAEGDVTQTTLTGAGALLGSPAYMAPEQIADARHVDARADLWSLGIVLCEALTGRLPFEALTTTGLLARIVGDPPRSPAELRPGLDEALSAIVLRCLEKDRALRFVDVAALGRALAPFATAGAALADEIAETLARRPSKSDPVEAGLPPLAHELTATDEPVPRGHELTATDEPVPRGHELTATDEPALHGHEPPATARAPSGTRASWAAIGLTAGGLVVAMLLLALGGRSAEPPFADTPPPLPSAGTLQASARTTTAAASEPSPEAMPSASVGSTSASPALASGVALPVPVASGRGSPRASARAANGVAPAKLATPPTVPEPTAPPDVFDRLGPRK